MSQIDLIILGYLQHGEKSAYEMVKEFQTWNMHHWLKISTPAIYKNIIKLSEAGYLNTRIVKEGEMPEKTIYTLNELGIGYYYNLMGKSANAMGNVYFDFNAFIINLNTLPSNLRSQYLDDFHKKCAQNHQLMTVSYQDQQNKKEAPDEAFLLMDLYMAYFKLLDQWSKSVKEHYTSI